MGERLKAARKVRGRAGAAAKPPAGQTRAAEDSVDWEGIEESAERLEEGEMEMLLTGHAATHGVDGDDNWMLETTRHDLD